MNLNDFTKELYGMTLAQAHEKGICISCKKPPIILSQTKHEQELARREYQISGLCEACFHEATREEEV